MTIRKYEIGIVFGEEYKSKNDCKKYILVGACSGQAIYDGYTV